MLFTALQVGAAVAVGGAGGCVGAGVGFGFGVGLCVGLGVGLKATVATIVGAVSCAGVDVAAFTLASDWCSGCKHSQCTRPVDRCADAGKGYSGDNQEGSANSSKELYVSWLCLVRSKATTHRLPKRLTPCSKKVADSLGKIDARHDQHAAVEND